MDNVAYLQSKLQKSDSRNFVKDAELFPFAKNLFSNYPDLNKLFDRYFSSSYWQDKITHVDIFVPTKFQKRGIENHLSILAEVFAKPVGEVSIRRIATAKDANKVDAHERLRNNLYDNLNNNVRSHQQFLNGLQSSRPPVGSSPRSSVPPPELSQKSFADFKRAPAPFAIVSEGMKMPYQVAFQWSRNEMQSGQAQLLWVYGDSGSGKSILVKQFNKWVPSHKKVCVIDVVKFFHEWRESLETRTHLEFAKKYRSRFDVFVLENIDFLQNKKATQEEVLFTINGLLDRGARVAVTSSLNPIQMKEIINPALFSRIIGGMAVQMPEPDREFKEKMWEHLTKIHKVQEWNYNKAIVQRVLSIPTETVRKSHSLLVNLIGRLSINGEVTEKDYADLDTQHRQIVQSQRKTKRPYDVMERICTLCGVNVGTIKGNLRRADITLARKFVYLALAHYLGLNNCTISRLCEKDPSTVCHAMKSIVKEIDTKRHIREQWQWISSQLGYQPKHIKP